jgi:hypothetical protein
MSDETTGTVEETGADKDAEKADVEKQAFLERLNKESGKRKDAEKRLAELEAKLAERETEGLPELERERKQREQLEKRLADAEKAREESEKAIHVARAERWVIAAAKDFADPEDATRFVDLADIEDADQAERAVKRIAKAKPHLLKSEDRKLPGRVLENGRAAGKDRGKDDAQYEEAARLAADLKQFIR